MGWLLLWRGLEPKLDVNGVKIFLGKFRKPLGIDQIAMETLDLPVLGRVGPIEIAILDRPKLAIHCRQISATFEVAFVDQRIVAALIGFPKRAVGFDRIKNSIQSGHRDGLTPSATFSGSFPFAGCRIALVKRVTFDSPQHVVHSFNQFQMLKRSLLANFREITGSRIGLVERAVCFHAPNVAVHADHIDGAFPVAFLSD